MNWFNNRLTKEAIYWPPPKKDGYGGYEWPLPLEVSTRWKDLKGSILYDKNSTEVISNSVVWIKEDVAIVGGYIMKGSMASNAGLLKPPIEDEYIFEDEFVSRQEFARQIIDIEKILSVYSSDVYTIKVWLK